MGTGMIAPTENTSMWNIPWEEITEPVDTVYSPSVFSVSIESVDGYNTKIKP